MIHETELAGHNCLQVQYFPGHKERFGRSRQQERPQVIFCGGSFLEITSPQKLIDDFHSSMDLKLYPRSPNCRRLLRFSSFPATAMRALLRRRSVPRLFIRFAVKEGVSAAKKDGDTGASVVDAFFCRAN